jgi:thiazole/oxazole-forming peptide maturase SagC family component
MIGWSKSTEPRIAGGARQAGQTEADASERDTKATAPGRTFVLGESVRVFRGGAGEVRFRKGIWNYTEAVLNFAGQPEDVAAFFAEVADELILHGRADLDEVARRTPIKEGQLEAYCDVAENLVQRHFLGRPGDDERAQVIRSLFGGTVSSFAENVAQARPVAFFADTPYAATAARGISDEVRLPMDLLDDDFVGDLIAADLTSRTEALDHARSIERLGKKLGGYFAVMGCFAQPNLTLLRNLNRLLVAAEKPLILGMVDGPFVTVLSTFARESGCFECYEQRMMARLEDTVAYQDFVRNAARAATKSTGPVLSPSLHLLTAAVMAEGILYSTLGMLRLAGRAISIYLPLLEIQAQDILRVPYCPACGFVSSAQMDDMYRSSNRLVSQMLASIELRHESS